MAFFAYYRKGKGYAQENQMTNFMEYPLLISQTGFKTNQRKDLY